MTELKRGDVYWITNDGWTGCEMAGKRPALIVSNNVCNIHSPIIQIVPLTTARKKPLPTHVHVMIGNRHSIVLCEQISIVDRQRLCGYKATLGEKEMRAVDRALRIQLGLEDKP